MLPKFPVELPRERFQYRELALAPIPNWGWDLKDFKSECLRRPAETFQWNLIRTSTFALMPAWIALEAIREQLWTDHATAIDGKQIEPDLTRYVEGEDYSDAAKETFARLVENYRKIPDDTFRRLLDEIGINHIEEHISYSRALTVGVELVFESVIKDSWTAFECLASELWAETLDKDNGTLATLVNPVLRRPSKKVIPLFNYKTHLGSYQVDMKQVVFQRIDDIERFYEAAFPHRARQLFRDVEGGYIFILAAFRNVFVHKRGIADQQFLGQIEGFQEYRGIFSLNEPILLNGALVKRMRDAAMVLGRKLVSLADEALQSQI